MVSLIFKIGEKMNRETTSRCAGVSAAVNGLQRQGSGNALGMESIIRSRFGYDNTPGLLDSVLRLSETAVKGLGDKDRETVQASIARTLEPYHRDAFFNLLLKMERLGTADRVALAYTVLTAGETSMDMNRAISKYTPLQASVRASE